MTKIECRDCWYYQVVESWAKDGKAWCRIQEAKIPADNKKTRCKNFNNTLKFK